MNASLQDRFRGCLLGLAVGDALGGRFEAQSAEFLRSRFPTTDALIDSVEGELWYTDDTQMTIGVAETLLARDRIDELTLCRAFASNYVPSRGYGRGARAVIEAMVDGGDYRAVASEYFPGGSFGNGAAMRVAPVGLFFHDDTSLVVAQAEASALPTHLHPLGVEGAQLVALAIAIACTDGVFNRDAYYSRLLAHCNSPEFRRQIERATAVQSADQLAALGNGIAALDSVPTAIASFAMSSESYVQAISNVILLGGDTDTIAAMAGAISGAYLGVDGIPTAFLDRLEDSPKGRKYLLTLADQLFERWQARRGPATRPSAE